MHGSFRKLDAIRRAWLTLAALTLMVVSTLHARWIFTHFSSDGYLYDSGWLAYLVGDADPLLRNPSVVNSLSFYAHHLSPHIFLFGVPFSPFGLGGIVVFALHQAAFFGLFFVSLGLIATAPASRAAFAAAAVTALLVGAVSNALLQAAAYPHYEIAMLSVASLAVSAAVLRARRLFLLCLMWLPLIREDGGFYGAVVCAAAAVISSGADRRGPWAKGRLVVYACRATGYLVLRPSCLSIAWVPCHVCGLASCRRPKKMGSSVPLSHYYYCEGKGIVASPLVAPIRARGTSPATRASGHSDAVTRRNVRAITESVPRDCAPSGRCQIPQRWSPPRHCRIRESASQSERLRKLW